MFFLFIGTEEKTALSRFIRYKNLLSSIVLLNEWDSHKYRIQRHLCLAVLECIF